MGETRLFSTIFTNVNIKREQKVSNKNVAIYFASTFVFQGTIPRRSNLFIVSLVDVPIIKILLNEKCISNAYVIEEEW